MQLHCVEACGGSVLTGLQIPERWWAGPRAKRVLTRHLAPGTHLLTPHWAKRYQSTKQLAAHHTGQPGHAPFVKSQPQLLHCLPQAGALCSLLPRNCHSASGVLETHLPALGTVHASDLWSFSAYRVSNTHEGRPGQGPSGF